MAVNGQRREKPADLGCAHLCRVPLVVEEDVTLDPRDVGFLGAATEVAGADGVADGIEQAWLRIRRRRLVDGEHERR